MVTVPSLPRARVASSPALISWLATAGMGFVAAVCALGKTNLAVGIGPA